MAFPAPLAQLGCISPQKRDFFVAHAGFVWHCSGEVTVKGPWHHGVAQEDELLLL